MKQNGVISLPVKTIIGKLLSGVFDSIMAGDGLRDNHRTFLEGAYKTYTDFCQFTGKIFKSYES